MIPLIPVIAAVAIVRLLLHKPEKKKVVPKADDFLTGENAALYAFNGDKQPVFNVPPVVAPLPVRTDPSLHEVKLSASTSSGNFILRAEYLGGQNVSLASVKLNDSPVSILSLDDTSFPGVIFLTVPGNVGGVFTVSLIDGSFLRKTVTSNPVSLSAVSTIFLASIQQPIDRGIVLANIHRWDIYLGASGGVLPYSFVRWEIDQGSPSPALQFGDCSQLPNPTPQQYFFGQPSAQGNAIRAVLQDGTGSFSTTPYMPLTVV